ncbi:MAG: tRNA glutamyl-Q(34) synthetase GluQRS [Neisseriaceae bacterium]|nr:tRNA glutamyl-Q(34) synthetase GluQRS [Neisseriaceae bacterium]
MITKYIGRFAPSPTGHLHIGSLLTAVASFIDAKAHNGAWLVRMEDLDKPREVKGAADDILRTLDAFALHWDGEVVYQSKRHALYRAALDDLQRKNLVYPCYCSRKTVQENGTNGIDGIVYNGNCRFRQPNNTKKQSAWRIKTDNQPIVFEDKICGTQQQNIAQEVGDFVLLRADGQWAYQLAVVVDDNAQGVTNIVRGSDLLLSCPRQIYLYQQFNFRLPEYAHLPLLTNTLGQKWSKQTLAPKLDLANKEYLLKQVLTYLGLPTPIPDENCNALLQWAILNWNINKVPKDDIICE